MNIKNASPATELATSILSQRIAQLTNDNLMQYYVSAYNNKKYIFESLDAMTPRDPLAILPESKHMRRKIEKMSGIIPKSGYYIFDYCYIGRGGTILDSDRRVYYADDLVSSYWLGFSGKLINKANINRNSLQHNNILGKFITGDDVATIHIRCDKYNIVSIIKPGSKVYGHWILDVLPMVYNLFEAKNRGEITPPFKFIISAATPSWAKEMLSVLFNIESDDFIYFDDERYVLAVDRIIVPSLMRVSPLISPRMNNFIDFIFDKFNIKDMKYEEQLSRRVFISRENYTETQRRIFDNVHGATNLIQELGFSIIKPEELNWRTQIKLFSEAEVVIGEYGSGMHNTIFSGSSTIAIVMSNAHSNLNQSSIAALRGQNMIYIRPSREEVIVETNGIKYGFDEDNIRCAIDIALGYKR